MIRMDLGSFGEVDFPEDIILQDEREFREMFGAIFPDSELRTILEIGTYEGGTAYVWAQLVSRFPDGKVICVDSQFGTDYEGCPFSDCHHTPPIYRVAPFGERITEIEGRSDSRDVVGRVGEILGERKVDLLFVDGGHSYGEAKGDFETYSRFVRPGGWIAFHDARNRTVGCSAYWDEIRQRYGGRDFVHNVGIGLLRWEGVLR